MFKTRTLGAAVLAGLSGALAASSLEAQQIAPRGVVQHDVEREQRLLQQVEVPAGFSATLFAGPPVAQYPACLATGPDDAVYVCVDGNLSLSTDPGRGYIVRLVDRDNDGSADEYTVFAEMDSPRGVVVDGNTVYVMHPPTLTAFRDTDGDGIADESEELVRGLGFGLDFRGADHTTNNIAMGIDGWIYVAVGDYGILEAVGKDGSRVAQRGGSVVRVRPDGTDLELYTVGTRNIYDVAVDPYLQLFSRDNTNDGDGWNTRLHYLPALADMGYPSRYRNFADELMPSLEDYGGGSGTGALWIQDRGMPEGFDNTLYTADWTVNKILRHPLRRSGASFEVEQEDFIALPRPSDLVIDSRSNLYVASLSGGSFTYAGDTVGYVVRVKHTAGTPEVAPDLASLDGAGLVEVLASFNATHRLNAQREILRRGADRDVVRRLERLSLDGAQPAYARVAGMFTLKQLVGERSHGVLRRAAGDRNDATVRALALRALADDRSELRGVPVNLFVRGLRDSDPSVQMQAAVGLVRLGAVKQAGELLPLAASDDPALSHVAVNALATLGARDVALRAVDRGTGAERTAALRALQQMHDPETVAALVSRVDAAVEAGVRGEILAALARLANREAEWEGPWDGGWWGTKPDFRGPYFEPVAWEGTATIQPVLAEALIGAEGAEFEALVEVYALNRVLPAGALPLLAAVDRQGGDQRSEVIRALVGRSSAGADVAPLLARLDAQGVELHAAVARLVAGEREVDPALLPLVRSAALDGALEAEVRGQLLTAVIGMEGEEALTAAIELFAQVNPHGSAGVPGPVEMAWRRFVGDRQRQDQVDRFIGLSRDGSAAERTLAYAVLAQSIRSSRTPEEVRERVTPVIDAAWGDEEAAARLVDAIELMRLESQYEAQLQSRAAGAQAAAGGE